MPFDLLAQNVPRTANRAGRVRLLAELAEALLDRRMPSAEAAAFVGSALNSWLKNGGSLERDYLKISAIAGSHATPSALWRALRDEASSRGAQGGDDIATVGPDIDSEGTP